MAIPRASRNEAAATSTSRTVPSRRITRSRTMGTFSPSRSLAMRSRMRACEPGWKSSRMGLPTSCPARSAPKSERAARFANSTRSARFTKIASGESSTRSR